MASRALVQAKEIGWPVAWVGWLNGTRHRGALWLFMAAVTAHMAEHIVQAYQIWVLGWSVPRSRGLLGPVLPWLYDSQWLHYGYALLTLIGLVVLRPGIAGPGRTWWTVALVIGFWHHLEHLLLLIQTLSGSYLFGAGGPTSILQLFFPVIELHLAYNTAVFAPMVAALVLHLRASAGQPAVP